MYFSGGWEKLWVKLASSLVLFFCLASLPIHFPQCNPARRLRSHTFHAPHSPFSEGQEGPKSLSKWASGHQHQGPSPPMVVSRAATKLCLFMLSKNLSLCELIPYLWVFSSPLISHLQLSVAVLPLVSPLVHQIRYPCWSPSFFIPSQHDPNLDLF